ncbi:Uncharacterised protein [Legionella busanensis]|uniref:Uncharacterized protein n=1 Tax=Legionella busanensis TaxID=190655 RepID=A0A378JL89_9GAMM|nr:hypothetical protein [Legionella busanensis]STX50989.1 Uncharacterised protein [Legionella busanensis]
MPHITLESEESQKQQLLNFYYDFMSKKNAEAQAFSSLDEFRASATYQNLPEEEKEQLGQHEGKNVIVLMFDDIEQVQAFMEQAQSKGLINKEQAEEVISRLNEKMQSAYKLGM